MATVIVNGVTYTDDDNSSTGMANGGHRLRFVPMLANAVIDLATKQAASAASQAAAAGSVAAAGISAATATTQANLAATQASSSSASASIATAAALSAASVLQQDLSAFTGALHRSPNAITAQFIYDTSKDSDGGAWIERMQDKSWANEPLNGKWLGPQASETTARAAGGTAGDYFQQIQDGVFYRLSATVGANTQVFRGNTAKFPRLSAIIAEAGSVTIYDLTAAGRPMWMRFVAITCGGNLTSSGAITASAGGSISSVAAVNGSLLISRISDASNVNGLNDINFLRESSRFYSNATAGGPFCGCDIVGTIAQRNVNGATTRRADFGIASGQANSVAMTVLPDATIDVATGLAVPTIAVATQGGVSVLKQDGTVVNITGNNWGATSGCVQISGTTLYVLQGAFFWYSVPLMGLTSGSFGDAVSPPGGSSVVPTTTFQITFAYIGIPSPTVFGHVVNFNGTNNIWKLVFSRQNLAAPVKGMVAYITNTYNTGHMVGDVRRCYLSSVTAETLSGAEKVTNGTFDTDTSGWTASGGGVLSSVNGALVVTQGVAASYGQANQVVTGLVAGKTYDVRYTVLSGGAIIQFGGVDYSLNNPGVYRRLYVAVGTSATWVIAHNTPDAVGSTFSIDNISVKLADEDRSYKAAAATVYGTLTKTPVGTGSQLVAYSGFSSANYLQEPYSADLDFGTGDFSISAWVKFSGSSIGIICSRRGSGNSKIDFYVNNGRIVFDLTDSGGSNRTLSTPAAYNTGSYVKVRGSYTAGRLGVLINGVEVASLTNAPLITLNDTTAALFVGIDSAGVYPFPGSIALLKVSGTIPTAEQALFAYTQEAAMFKDGAQVALPDAGAVQDLTYDDQQDKWVAVSTANESSFTGLVRTATAAVTAGSFVKASARSGVKLLSRTAGADVTLPAYGLREELLRRAEAAAKQSKTLTVFDYDAIGAQTDFALPIGWRTTEVLSAGASKREGATKDWVRLYDGFRETIRFATAPGAAVWVQLTAKRE